jgi:3D (Asp-Asp-Asp) domain-containing protein
MIQKLFWRGILPACCITLSINLAATAQSPEQGREAIVTAAPEIPALPSAPLHPPLDISTHPSENKIKEASFAEPEKTSRHAPRSFSATAYSLRGRTASGVYTRPGVVAADPRVLPLGSVVEIKAGNYSGVYTVYDTGARIKGNIVDVWLPSTREARHFGRRRVKLQVLRYGKQTRAAKSAE